MRDVKNQLELASSQIEMSEETVASTNSQIDEVKKEVKNELTQLAKRIKTAETIQHGVSLEDV